MQESQRGLGEHSGSISSLRKWNQSEFMELNHKTSSTEGIQVAYTLFQLFVIIFVVSVSLELLFRFDKFRDLSLLIHVFTALFICAMPKIIQSMCTADHSKRGQKQKLISDIKETINDYLDGETETDFNVFQFTD